MHSQSPSSLSRSATDWTALAVGRRRRLGLEPGLQRAILRVDMRQVGDEVLHHRQVRQRIDPDRPLHLVDRLEARQRVGAIDVHRAGAADPPRGTSGGRSASCHLVLDLDECVEDHRAAGIEIDLEAVETRRLPVIGIQR